MFEGEARAGPVLKGYKIYETQYSDISFDSGKHKPYDQGKKTSHAIPCPKIFTGNNGNEPLLVRDWVSLTPSPTRLTYY